MADWPWSDLGIGETADREKIYEAYRAKIDKLNLSSPISAYTRLSEAREKALPLARQGTARTTGKADGADGNGGSLAMGKGSVGCTQAIVGTYAITGASRTYREEEVRLVDDGEAGARHSPELSHPLQSLSAKLDRFRLIMPLFFGAAYLLVSAYNYFFAERTSIAAEYWQPDWIEKALADQAGMSRVSARLPDLFGAGYSADQLAKDQPELTASLVRTLDGQFGDNEIDNLRSVLRSTIVHSRSSMSRELLLEESGIYLMWLRSADRAQDGSCRDVTGHSFFNGLPIITGDDLAREQVFARKLMKSGLVDFNSEIDNTELPPIPDWTIAEVKAQTGMDEARIRSAFTNLADPDKCAVTIAVLESLLKRPNDAPGDLQVTI